MNRTKYLVKNTLVFALGNIGTKIINFFLVPMYTLVLSTEEYGTIDLIFTICMFVFPIVILNIYESVMRFCLDKDVDSNNVMSVGLLILFLSLGLSGVCAFISKSYAPIADYYIYIFLYIVSMNFSQVFLCYLRGKEQLLKYSFGNIIQTILIAMFNIIFLVVYKSGVQGYLIAYIIANFITAIYAFFAGDIITVIRNFFIDKNLLISMVKYSTILIPNSFMWWIMNSADRIMLSSITGAATIGIYAVANKIPSLISMISTIFNQAFSYSAIKENESENKEEFINVTFSYLLSSVTILGIVLIIIIKPFMRLYVGTEYFEAWIYAPTLIVATCILVLASFLSIPYTVNKDSKGFLCSSLVGAIVNIFLNFLFIPEYGIMGATVATLASYFAVLLYRVSDVKKYINIHVFSLKHLTSIISLGMMCILSYLDHIVAYFIMFFFLLLNFILYINHWKKIWKKICKK